MIIVAATPALRVRSAPPTAIPAPRVRSALPVMSGAAPYDYTLLTLHPTYTIADWARARPIMEDFIAVAKAEPRLAYCGYATTRSTPDPTVLGDHSVAPGDRLFCREAFPDAEALLSHLSTVKQQREALVDGPAALEDLQLHGPAAALREVDESGLLDSMGLGGCRFFETKSGLSRLEKEWGGMPLPLQLLSLHTTFTIAENETESASAICDEIVALATEEENCLYCGWTRNGNQLCCQEAYGSVVGLARHVAAVSSCIDRLLDGPATLDGGGQLHASLGQAADFQQYVEETGRERGYCSKQTERFVAETGYSRYEVQQSMFGWFFRR